SRRRRPLVFRTRRGPRGRRDRPPCPRRRRARRAVRRNGGAASHAAAIPRPARARLRARRRPGVLRPRHPAARSRRARIARGSPWKWEELIVESAIVGGRSRADGKARWRRRLDGLAADYRFRIAELERDEPESARIARFKRDLKNLGHLREFALPIVDELAG